VPFERPEKDLPETTDRWCIRCGSPAIERIGLEHSIDFGPIRAVHRCRDCEAVFVLVRPRPGSPGQPQRPAGAAALAEVLLEELRRTIHTKLAEGVLPRTMPDRLSVVPGTGVRCVICDRPIVSPDVEVEYGRPGGATQVLHARCYQRWAEECRRTGGA
jgi:hypothetical protein